MKWGIRPALTWVNAAGPPAPQSCASYRRGMGVMAILEISYRNMGSSESVEGLVRQRFAQLEKIHGRLASCRVVIEKAREEGKSFHVHVVMVMPGHEIVVRRDRSDDPVHGDALATIRDAFDAARRQLEDHVRRMDDRVKAHGPGAD